MKICHPNFYYQSMNVKHPLDNITRLLIITFQTYTAQNKYVCARLFAFFDVLNAKVYIILKLVQFPIQL